MCTVRKGIALSNGVIELLSTQLFRDIGHDTYTHNRNWSFIFFLVLVASFKNSDNYLYNVP